MNPTTPTDDQLLDDLLDHSLTLPAIAKQHSLTLAQLLRRLREPGFRDLLTALQEITEAREQLANAAHRAEALSALLKALDPSAEPDEPRRKAAEAILRATRPPARSRAAAKAMKPPIDPSIFRAPQVLIDMQEAAQRKLDEERRIERAKELAAQRPRAA